MNSWPASSAEWTLPTRHLGGRVRFYAALSSTLALAAELARDPEHLGLAILADSQTAGRGQYGRTWLAPPGAAVLLSVILQPPEDLHRPVYLTAWVALAVLDTLRPHLGGRGRIKWPNDILVRGQKICGILIESPALGSRPPCIVLGIGLNVNQSRAELDAAGLPQATSLAAAGGGNHAPRDLANALLLRLDRSYARLLRGGLPAMEKRWRTRISLLGQTVRVALSDAEAHVGTLVQLDFDAIALQTASGTIHRWPPERVRQILRP